MATGIRMQPYPRLSTLSRLMAMAFALWTHTAGTYAMSGFGESGSGESGLGDADTVSPSPFTTALVSSVTDTSTSTSNDNRLMPFSTSLPPSTTTRPQSSLHTLPPSSSLTVSPAPTPTAMPSPALPMATSSPTAMPSPLITALPMATSSPTAMPSPLITALPMATSSPTAMPLPMATPTPIAMTSSSVETSSSLSSSISSSSETVEGTPLPSPQATSATSSPKISGATPSPIVPDAPAPSPSPIVSPSPEASLSPGATPSPSLIVSFSPEASLSPGATPSRSLIVSPSPEMSETTPFPEASMMSEATPLPSPSPPVSVTTPTGQLTTTTTAALSIIDTLLEALGEEGLAGAAVALAVILILLLILCCICCCCICKRIRKRDTGRLDLANHGGIGFENRGVSLYGGSNGMLGMKYEPQNSLLDLRPYGPVGEESTGFHYNETAIDPDLDFPGHSQSQILPSQLSLANSDVFKKSTLPELSPMAYSLTATYPFPSEDHGLYLGTLPASTLSLQQPTRLGLSLQEQEESKSSSRLSMHGSRPSVHGSRPSVHGSRPSIHGSRPSIHESRPSIYSSRTSSMQGSRHLLYASGTSGESLLSGGRYDKEHSIEDQEMGGAMGVAMDGDDLSLSNPIIYSPQLLSNAGSMEVPTRDSSPFQRPLATSHQLGHGRKDFASLTCIINPSIGSPSPELQGEWLDKGISPTHKKPRRDLTALTSVGTSPSHTSKQQEETIPEEGEESAKVKKSPSTKKGRSKTMSRLEKLTSLDYIRQSFRIKKKKVSFQKTPETTPTPSKKKGSNGGTTTIATIQADKESPQRRVSNVSSDMFSPTEESFLRAEQQGQHMMGVAHGDLPMMGPMPIHGYPQLSQPSYFLPHPYAYPQLSQQYHPQLSQSYVPYPSPYHHMATAEPLRTRDHRYQDVVTPDFSDITTPEHARFRERPLHSPEPQQGSEFSYDLRAHTPEQSPDKFTESEHYQQDLMDEYGGHHLGIHPEYVRSPKHYGPESFPLGSPQRYSMGGGGYARSSMERTRRSSLEQDRRFRSKGGEGPLPNSISVDDPHRHYSLSHRGKHTEHRYSGVSESSNAESRLSENPGGESGKGRVSWSSEVTEYPAEN